MNREEATYLLKEIISTCEGLNAQTAVLMPANEVANVLSQECQIRIQPCVTERNFQHIKTLVKKTDLSVIDEPNSNITTIRGDIAVKSTHSIIAAL